MESSNTEEGELKLSFHDMQEEQQLAIWTGRSLALGEELAWLTDWFDDVDNKSDLIICDDLTKTHDAFKYLTDRLQDLEIRHTAYMCGADDMKKHLLEHISLQQVTSPQNNLDTIRRLQLPQRVCVLNATFEPEDDFKDEPHLMTKALVSHLADKIDPDRSIFKEKGKPNHEEYFAALFEKCPHNYNIFVLLHGISWYQNRVDLERAFKMLWDARERWLDDVVTWEDRIKESKQVDDEYTRAYKAWWPAREKLFRGKVEEDLEVLNERAEKLRKDLDKAMKKRNAVERRPGPYLRVLIAGPGAMKVTNVIPILMRENLIRSCGVSGNSPVAAETTAE